MAVASIPGSALAGAQAGGGSVTGRIVLVAVVLVAVGAFTVLQLMARSRSRDHSEEPGRTRGYEQDGGPDKDDDALFEGHENWGYWSPPGYRGSPQPPWSTHQPR